MKALIDGDAVSYIIGYASESTGYRYVTEKPIMPRTLNNASGFDMNDSVPEPVKDKNNFILDFLNCSEKHTREKLLELGYEEPIELEKVTHVADVEHSLYLTRLLMDQILDDTGADEYHVYLTSEDKSNFRFKVAITQAYKGNRKDSRKPHNLSAIRKYLLDSYNAEVVYNMEADDALGIMQCASSDTIICDNDKDTWMIPGQHYNVKTREFFLTEDPGFLELVNNRKKLRGGGLLWFYAQMLLGDTADNIPGLKGYGPVKVFNLLDGVEDELNMLQIVRNEYILNRCEDRLIEVGFLLWILRTPIDQKGQHIQQMLGQLT